MSISQHLDISVLLGKTLRAIKGGKSSDSLTFVTDSGEVYLMEHQQDCCESVTIEDIAGDLQDLIGLPLLQAEEVSDHEPYDYDSRPDTDNTCTWTFYKLATNKGRVTIRWYGTSNGYYSEEVSFGLVS